MAIQPLLHPATPHMTLSIAALDHATLSGAKCLVWLLLWRVHWLLSKRLHARSDG